MTNHDTNPNNRERENPTAEEQQKKAEREHPKATNVITTKTENLTLGAGDSYLLHPGATEETERAKREYNAEKQAELDRAKALDRQPGQFRSSKSEVQVRALDVDNKEDDQQKNNNNNKKSR